MMDEKLLGMLDELNDINSEILGTLSVLDIVDAYYEHMCEKILVISG